MCFYAFLPSTGGNNKKEQIKLSLSALLCTITLKIIVFHTPLLLLQAASDLLTLTFLIE